MWHRRGAAESRHDLPTLVLGTGLPCLSPDTQDKYSSDADAGKQTEARGQSQRSWVSPTASDSTRQVSVTDRLFVKEVIELEANLPYRCKVHVSDPSELHCFQLSPQIRVTNRLENFSLELKFSMHTTRCLPK